MTFEMDLEIRAALQPLLEAAGSTTVPPVGDWRTRRERTDAKMMLLTRATPAPSGVVVSHYRVMAGDGSFIGLRIYQPAVTAGTGLVVFLHGGGQFCGSVDIYDPVYRRYADSSGTAVLAVDFRFAPEHPFPTPIEDCYSALCWAENHARELGYDPTRIAVAGDSAGGGMAAALALMARDRGGPNLSGQVLIYPMLDDRTMEPDPLLVPVMTWNYDDNATGWSTLLGNRAGESGVSPYAAPARAVDLFNLPPAYIEVGQLDIFRDESIIYATSLSHAGVPVEFHLHAGAPHGYDQYAPRAGISERAVADRARAIAGFCSGLAQ